MCRQWAPFVYQREYMRVFIYSSSIPGKIHKNLIIVTAAWSAPRKGLSTLLKITLIFCEVCTAWHARASFPSRDHAHAHVNMLLPVKFYMFCLGVFNQFVANVFLHYIFNPFTVENFKHIQGVKIITSLSAFKAKFQQWRNFCCSVLVVYSPCFHQLHIH